LLTTLGFTAVYAVLMVADIYLLRKYARADTEEVAAGLVPSDEHPGAAVPLIAAP
jgi:hypothetical protein